MFRRLFLLSVLARLAPVRQCTMGAILSGNNSCLAPADSGKIHKVLEAGSKPFIISETQLSSRSPVQSIKLDSIKVLLMTEILGVAQEFLNDTSILGHFQWHQCTHHIQWHTQLTLGGEGDTRRGPCVDVPEEHYQSFTNCPPAGHLCARFSLTGFCSSTRSTCKLIWEPRDVLWRTVCCLPAPPAWLVGRVMGAPLCELTRETLTAVRYRLHIFRAFGSGQCGSSQQHWCNELARRYLELSVIQYLWDVIVASMMQHHRLFKGWLTL